MRYKVTPWDCPEMARLFDTFIDALQWGNINFGSRSGGRRMTIEGLLLALMTGIKKECLKGTSCSKCPFGKKRLAQNTNLSGKLIFPVTYRYEITCSIGNPESWLLDIEDELEVDE